MEDFVNANQNFKWRDIEPIWEKWTNLEIPQGVLALCEEASIITRDYLLKLNAINVDKGNLSTSIEKSFKRGEDLGQAMANSMRACFMLGLEYGDKDKDSLRTDDFVSQQAKLALPFLRAALQPITKYGSQLIGLLIKSRNLSMTNAEKLSEELGRTSLKSAAQSFRIGLEYSAKI